MHLIHVRLQTVFVGVRIPAFRANKSPAFISGGQLSVSVSTLTAATRTIGAHLAKTQMLIVRWFETTPQEWVVLSYLKYIFHIYVDRALARIQKLTVLPVQNDNFLKNLSAVFFLSLPL